LARVDSRIMSMSRTHELLSDTNWRGVELAKLAECELAPYAASRREVGGPNVTLKAEAAQAVVIVFHELTTGRPSSQPPPSFTAVQSDCTMACRSLRLRSRNFGIADALLDVGSSPLQLLLGCNLDRCAADVLVVEMVVWSAGQA
jgi:HWE histidine kinase